MTERQKVRYAIVGLGDIAQEDMIPGVSHTGNSEITALVTSDSEKATILGKKHQVPTFSYEQFDQALKSGTFDAIYLATPNWRHAEFIVPALKADIHVLTEKPLEISTEKCREILECAKTSTAKLMVAYRLHFEPATLATINEIRSGRIGDVHTFASSFSQIVDPTNHRVHNGELAGPLFDMGPYPVNAARYVFESEPTEVLSAIGVKHQNSGFDKDFYDTVFVTLKFPGDRIAQFNLGYSGGPVNNFVAIGSKGAISLEPSYSFGKPLKQTIVVGKETKEKEFENTDHFGGELKYFSDCILDNLAPEPDGEEGYADVRVLEGILQALTTGKSVELSPFSRSKRIDTATQLVKLKAVKTPELVNAKNPSKGVEKQDKN